MVAPAVVEMPTEVKTGPPKLSDVRASMRYLGPDHFIAWHGNVQIVLSKVAPTMPAMAEIADQLEKLGAQSRSGTGCLLIIRSDVSPPSEEVRQFIRIKLERSSMLAAAQVVLGTGFRGAAMRSMLSLLQIAIRPKFAMRIFGDVRSGSDWLSQVLQERKTNAPPPEALKRTVQELVDQVF